ncbi:hypothetical protein EYC80_000271 [Monilinia laxa]|uniref:Uncharacterized protein n=1 Tax=Monilinia laxa TaxID=61186 RepID=A0A5N6KA92_MONLA|nr:hypothetical protein EYC80_000271 [Monilinia laxa]
MAHPRTPEGSNNLPGDETHAKSPANKPSPQPDHGNSTVFPPSYPVASSSDTRNLTKADEPCPSTQEDHPVQEPGQTWPQKWGKMAFDEKFSYAEAIAEKGATDGDIGRVIRGKEPPSAPSYWL